MDINPIIIRFIMLLPLFLVPVKVCADTEGDYLGLLIKYLMEKHGGHLEIHKAIDLNIGLGNISSVSKPNWPRFLRQCGEACLPVTSMLHEFRCTESLERITAETDSPIYNFVIADEGSIYKAGDFNFYTAPYLLKSCHLLLTYKVGSEVKAKTPPWPPLGSATIKVKTKEKLTAILFSATSGRIEPISEQILLEYDREYSFLEGEM